MSEPNIQRLGPYEIEGILGRGGMGSVFAARHERTGERAAIKVLAPALAADESFRERFIAEIESLKTLRKMRSLSRFARAKSQFLRLF